jgi:hypothetical protein
MNDRGYDQTRRNESIEAMNLRRRVQDLEGHRETQDSLIRILRSKLGEATIDNRNMAKMAIVLQQIGFRPARVGETPVTYMTRLGLEIADAKLENPGYPGPIHPSSNSWINMYSDTRCNLLEELPESPSPETFQLVICDLLEKGCIPQ